MFGFLDDCRWWSGGATAVDEEMMRTRRLAKVRNRQGRIDVLLYRLASRALFKLEQKHGVMGLEENLMPMVEDLIMAHIPNRNMLPREVESLLHIIRMNQGKLA
jgi:hypothetical protein